MLQTKRVILKKYLRAIFMLQTKRVILNVFILDESIDTHVLSSVAM